MEYSIDIDAPPSRVFTWIEEPDRVCQWVHNMESNEVIEEKEGKVGTRSRHTC